MKEASLRRSFNTNLMEEPYQVYQVRVAGTGNGTIPRSCLKFRGHIKTWVVDECRPHDLQIPAICERRIEEIPCSGDSDCGGNATCTFNQVINLKHGDVIKRDLARMTCTCNFGFYGNGSVCERTRDAW